MSSPAKKFSNTYTIFFVALVCFVSAGVLSLLATKLREPQGQAAELDRNKQLMIAAKIYHPDGYFMKRSSTGAFVPAKWDSVANKLVDATVDDTASADELIYFASHFLLPMVVDDAGSLKSFSEANLDFAQYVKENTKSGFAQLPQKLIYCYVPGGDVKKNPIEAYIVPVNGRGLWDSIYGYLGISSDGETVISTTWYKQAETAGLGANIALPSWQAQFAGKKIFMPNNSGQTNYAIAPMGITVVKGRVKDAVGDAPKAISCVDGIAGSTLTGNGVSAAYQSSIAPYRAFFMKVVAAHQQKSTPKVS